MEAVSRELTQKVSKEIQEAILPILEKHGLKATKFNSKYGDSYGLSIAAVSIQLDENGVNLNSAEAILYQRFGYTAWLGKSLDDRVELKAKLGTKFTSAGKEYVFAGIRSRGKNKIVAKGKSDGKDYVFADSIVTTLNKANA